MTGCENPSRSACNPYVGSRRKAPRLRGTRFSAKRESPSQTSRGCRPPPYECLSPHKRGQSHCPDRRRHFPRAFCLGRPEGSDWTTCLGQHGSLYRPRRGFRGLGPALPGDPDIGLLLGRQRRFSGFQFGARAACGHGRMVAACRCVVRLAHRPRPPPCRGLPRQNRAKPVNFPCRETRPGATFGSNRLFAIPLLPQLSRTPSP